MNIAILTVPVVLDTTSQPSQLAHQWVRTYHYGHRTFPPISVLTCLLYGYAAFSKHADGSPWRVFAVAGAFTLSMVPFTWIFMTRTNNALFREQRQSKAGQVASLGEVQKLVTKWNGLHTLRSLLPLTGAVFGMLGICQVLVF